MDKEASAVEYDKMFQDKLKERSIGNVQATDDLKDCEVIKTLDNLRWFHQLNEAPDAIKPLMVDGVMEIGT
jgi:hypothetical protein